MAVAGGAGLAGGFNTPLMGVVFVAEEFLGTFSMQPDLAGFGDQRHGGGR